MDHPTYKVIHLAGLMLLFLSLGGLAILGAVGADAARTKAFRGVLSAFHGIGLLILAVAGFGLLARLQMGSPATWGGWVYAKLGLWLVFGAAVVPLKRAPHLAKVWLLVFGLLGAVTAWLAIFKPF